MNGIFLDSAGLIALWNRRDQWHEAAASAFGRFPRDAALVTTSYVLAECANAFSRSDLRNLLVALGERLEAEHALIFPSDIDWREAWTRFSREHPGSPSLIDQLSFAVMHRLGLSRAFTNDQHFATAGFEALF